MGKFEKGNIIKVIKIIYGTDDVIYGLHKGMLGTIEEIDPINKDRYLVKFVHRENLVPMLDSQMAFAKENAFNYEPTVLPLQCISINEKEKKYMRILDLYKFRKLEEINIAKENKLKEIKSFDSIHSLLDDTEEQLNALLGREENNKVTIEVKNLNGQPLYDDIAENKIKQVFDEYNKKLHDLDKVTEEASALLELTSDYEEQIKILKKYNILDKGGKLNV